MIEAREKLVRGYTVSAEVAYYLYAAVLLPQGHVRGLVRRP